MKKNGFTLAEVLITLGIIGVVAALVMPGLIANYKKKEYVVRLKKFYSTLQQGISLYTAKEGVSDFDSTELVAMMRSPGTLDKARLDEIMGIIFNKVVSCNKQSDKKCGGIKYKGLSGADYTGWGGAIDASYTYVLPDSMIISMASLPQVWLDGGACAANVPVTDRNGRCIRVWVDINGRSGPNISGRDMFAFGIRADGRVVPADFPTNVDLTQNTSGCSADASVAYDNDACSLKIIQDNWEMNY